MTYQPNPGYVTLWKEEDKNFDGIIDAYRQRDRKGVSRVGQPMDPLPVRPPEAADAAAKPASPSEAAPGSPQTGAAGSGPRKTDEQELVDRMNERWNYR